jgi:nitrite reductase/ring-hydroxylating ferredoxin subunit
VDRKTRCTGDGTAASATPIDGLEDMERCLSEGLVPVSIYNDAAIFQAEQSRIFGRCWVFLGHESEIPNAGDFVLRKIGTDPVIVTRSSDRAINVLSNYCRHRGTEICRADRGNRSHFKCPYHGWVYSNTGAWVGAPHMNEAYGGKLDAKQWGLMRAPQVDVIHGLIFATLDPNAPPLRTYLGAACWMLEALFTLHPSGVRVVGPPDRILLKSDWKIPSDNFSGDDYHLESTHSSTEKIGVTRGFSQSCFIGHSFELGNGHNFVGHDAARTGAPLWGYPPDISSHFDLSRLDDVQRKMVTDTPPTVGTIFPNLSFIRSIGIAQPDRPPAIFTSLRLWQPVAPGLAEYWNWHLEWVFLAEDHADRAYEIGQYNVGAAGMIEQDDTAVWEGPAKASASPWLRAAGAKFHFQQGQPGPTEIPKDPSWNGPGTHRASGFGDYRQLEFYRHWLRLMRQPMR